ncbi:MAG: hypothetical protein WAN72_10635 [Candidatus Acidiferrales bacterium]
MRARLSVLFLSLFLVPRATELKVENAAVKRHPGTVVDAYTDRGILAKTHAYGSQHVQKAEECPVYDNSLDNQESHALTGAFTFNIPAANSSYLAVYCQEGYVSRTETINANAADRTRVQPDPIKLIPLKARLPAEVEPGTVIFVAIASDLDELRSNFRYYENASPASFSDALRTRLAPADRDMVEAISRRPTPFHLGPAFEPNPRFGELSNGNAAYVATATDIDNAHSDFVYYEQANKEAYAVARSKFPAEDQSIIDRIRRRSPPLLSPNHQ